MDSAPLSLNLPTLAALLAYAEEMAVDFPAPTCFVLAEEDALRLVPAPEDDAQGIHCSISTDDYDLLLPLAMVSEEFRCRDQGISLPVDLVEFRLDFGILLIHLRRQHQFTQEAAKQRAAYVPPLGFAGWAAKLDANQ